MKKQNIISNAVRKLKHYFTVCIRSRQTVTVETTLHAASRFRRRFLPASKRGVVHTKAIKDSICKHIQTLYKQNKLECFDDQKYRYNNEVWVLKIKNLKTHVKIKVVTCWKDL